MKTDTKMEKFSLKWNDFKENISQSFNTLRKENDFYDVSLVSDDDEVVSAHKVVLSASSEFFKTILRKADHSKPMIYLSGVKAKALNNILDYIYEGEVQLLQEDLKGFLDVADKLRINGLIGVGTEDNKVKEEIIDLHNEHRSFGEETSISNDQDPLRRESSSTRKIESKTKKAERIVSVKTNLDTNIYEEAKRAVDDILMKDGDNWVCNVCNKSSTKNCDMRKHAELHIKGLSFPCQLCKETFRSRTKLQTHKKNHRN